MVSVGLTFVPTATMTYVSDCYLPINADALELVNGVKNIVAFGFLYGVVPWVTKDGYINAFGAQAGVSTWNLRRLSFHDLSWNAGHRYEHRLTSYALSDLCIGNALGSSIRAIWPADQTHIEWLESNYLIQKARWSPSKSRGGIPTRSVRRFYSRVVGRVADF